MTETTTAPALPKAYRPADFEGEIYDRWLAADVFAPDGAGATADADAEPFTVIQPPPNITGSLHLGHAQRTAVEDLMIRHARMKGRPTLFLPGLDHASIAAQFVLDGIIAREGESRQSLGRERYLERMRQFVDATRPVMLGQQRRVGASCDWGRLRYTMDEGSAVAVREAFARLYRDGLAYRTEALVNWCPGCRTSVSDLEVVPTPQTGTLWTVRYHLIDPATGQPGDRSISVATTRPETILGDTAVAVHPDDPRYRNLVGASVRIPFVDRDVPLIADETVERAFGTGAVKITPAHDHDDYATGQRHGLPMLTVLDDQGRVAGTGTAWDGLDRSDARRAIVKALEEHGDLEATRAHEMVIGRCQRSDDVVEPRLKTQWFVRTAPLAERALQVTRAGQTRILPERFEKVWEHWMTGIRDWNVSRQLWWGHRIPAWYCPDGHATVTADADGPEACETCGRSADELTQDADIFDTWFSSGLWPFSTLGWPDPDSPDFARFYPTNVMETGYDILFFWVARMMMLGIHLTDRPPFEVVYLSGLIRDPLGQKMSKTKGNVLDPLGIIDESGADALRFALIHGATPGNDQRISPARIENARNFANKLWNAARFVLGARPASIPQDAQRQVPDEAQLGTTERWIRSRAGAATAAVDRALEEYAFGEVTRVLYDAIWSEFCDWGLELAKVRLNDESLPDEQRAATWWTLVDALDTYLRLLHPVMPFVTEALWGSLPRRAADPELLIVARWPGAGERDAAIEADVEAVLELVRAVRNARSEARVEPAAWLPLEVAVSARLAPAFDALQPAVERLARARPLVRHATAESLRAGPAGLAVVSGELEAVVVTADAGAGGPGELDRNRLEKELAEAEGFLTAAQARLANEAFTMKAPPSVVDGARAREAELADTVRRLRERLAE
jgi:valyl-tRNA synthetase